MARPSMLIRHFLKAVNIEETHRCNFASYVELFFKKKKKICVCSSQIDLFNLKKIFPLDDSSK